MSSKQNIGKIIKEQRKSIPLTQKRLSQISGVSIAHLVRIESGERVPSPHALQQIARPLGLDLNELLIMGGYLSPEPSALSEEQRDKLLAELNMLLERLVSGTVLEKLSIGFLRRANTTSRLQCCNYIPHAHKVISD